MIVCDLITYLCCFLRLFKLFLLREANKIHFFQCDIGGLKPILTDFYQTISLPSYTLTYEIMNAFVAKHQSLPFPVVKDDIYY